MAQSDQCITCKHYLCPTICEAFPDGDLPVAIITGEVDHRQPYPGDHGVQWEPLLEGSREP